MKLFGLIVLSIISLLHYYICLVEVFFWNKSLGIKSFKLEQKFADSTKMMAINQGVYNGFLAAGILYSIVSFNKNMAMFFAACVLIAGIVGGITSNKKIILIQSVPAVIAIVLLVIGI